MIRYRYGLTLRPLGQNPLARLRLCQDSPAEDGRYPSFGTAAFHRRLTAFEANQLDLVFLGEEECQCPN